MTPIPLEAWIASKIGASGQLTRQAIEAYQAHSLKNILDYVRQKSPFYRRHFASIPAGIGSLRDLEKYPFTTADDIRCQPLQFVCVSQDEIERVVTLSSTGTTGNPKRLYFTEEDQELTIDFFHIGMSMLAGEGDRVLILLPGDLPGSVGDLLAKGLDRLGAYAVKHGPVCDPENTLAVMAKEEINCLVGVPVQVQRLAHCCRVAGAAPLQLKSILLTTDHVPQAIAKRLQESWGCEVFNHYGMTEMGLGGGVDCFMHSGYHLREADLYFEIIDPESEETLPDGAYGEIVITTLTRYGMPLVRYRTGDVSRFIPRGCDCGTVLKTLEKVGSRLNERVMMPGGDSLTTAELDEILFSVGDVVDFSVDVEERATGEIKLTFGVEVVGGMDEAKRDIVYQALGKVPAIERGLRQACLVVDVEEKSFVPGRMMKRTLNRVSC